MGERKTNWHARRKQAGRQANAAGRDTTEQRPVLSGLLELDSAQLSSHHPREPVIRPADNPSPAPVFSLHLSLSTDAPTQPVVRVVARPWGTVNKHSLYGARLHLVGIPCSLACSAAQTLPAIEVPGRRQCGVTQPKVQYRLGGIQYSTKNTAFVSPLSRQWTRRPALRLAAQPMEW